MLDGLVRIIELRADTGYILALGIHQQFLDPVDADHLRIVVQQDDVLAFCLPDAEIVDLRIIEGFPFGPFILCDPDPFLYGTAQKLRIILSDLFRGTAVLHDHDLVIVIGRLIQDRRNAAL